MITELTPFQRIILFISLSLGTFMMILDYSIANVSIPYIAGDLSVSTDEGTYVITSFAVGSAIGLAMTGWLTKRIGQIRLITIAILLFTLLSLFCGLSINLNMLIISRFLQGLVSGPVIPLSQSLILSLGKYENRVRSLSIFATIVITAPVLGPILGGYLSDWYSWSWIFYINIPIGIFCAIIIWTLLHTQESPIEKVPGDLLGIFLLVMGVGCLQIFLDKGQQWDWLNSQLICLLILITIISFTFLIIRELWTPHPLLDLYLFAFPSFSLSIISLSISYAIYFGTVVLVPLWLQEYMGYNAEWAGLAVSTLGIAPVCLSMITPLIIRKFGNILTLLFAFIIFGISSFYTAYFTTAVDLQHIALSRFIFGIGFVCYINPLLGMSVQEIPDAKLPSATGIFHFVRAMVGGIGTSVFTTLWLRRTIYHHERIGANLTPFNPMTPHVENPQSLALLNNAMDQQAALLAINDAFYLMGWLFVGLVVLLLGWYFKNRKASEPAPATPLHVAE
ncbi:MAG: DHA2 family efflux MFS transporter permease subunit [Chlamydiota bacterium]